MRTDNRIPDNGQLVSMAGSCKILRTEYTCALLLLFIKSSSSAHQSWSLMSDVFKMAIIIQVPGVRSSEAKCKNETRDQQNKGWHRASIHPILHPASCILRQKKIRIPTTYLKLKSSDSDVRVRVGSGCRSWYLFSSRRFFGSHRHSAGSWDMDTWGVTRHASASDGSMNHRVRVVRSWHRMSISSPDRCHQVRLKMWAPVYQRVLLCPFCPLPCDVMMCGMTKDIETRENLRQTRRQDKKTHVRSISISPRFSLWLRSGSAI